MGDDDDVYQEFYQTVTQSTFPYVFIREVCQLQQTYLRDNRSSNEKPLKGFPNYNGGNKRRYMYAYSVYTYMHIICIHAYPERHTYALHMHIYMCVCVYVRVYTCVS